MSWQRRFRSLLWHWAAGTAISRAADIVQKSSSDQERMLEGKEGNLRPAAEIWSIYDRVRLAQIIFWTLRTQRCASYSFPKISGRFQSCGHANGLMSAAAASIVRRTRQTTIFRMASGESWYKIIEWLSDEPKMRPSADAIHGYQSTVSGLNLSKRDHAQSVHSYLWCAREIVDHEISYSLEKEFVLRCPRPLPSVAWNHPFGSGQPFNLPSLPGSSGELPGSDRDGQALDPVRTNRFFLQFKTQSVLMHR